MIKTEDIKVSIITPMYNCERFIASMIESVLNQTHSNFELLLIDDCSTDKSVEIASSFDDERIIVIKNEVNSGAAFSRNRGIEEAKGDYIAFLDADDLWEKDKLERNLNFLLLNNYDFSYTKYSVIDEDGEDLGVEISGPSKVTHKMFLRSNYIGCSTVMYKRSIYPDLKIPNSIKKRNDYALWLELSKKADCYLFDQVLTKYRKRSASISSGKKINLIKHHYFVFKDVCKFSKFKALLYSLINAAFYFIRNKKYKITTNVAPKKNKKDDTKLESGIFVFVCLTIVALLYFFGNSVGSIKCESNCLAATRFCESESSVHLKVLKDGGIDYDSSNTFMREVYGQKQRLRPYLYSESNLHFSYNGFTHNAKLCNSPVYNDFDYTEYLELPLYLDDSSIRKGKLYNADYASYIPSSLADYLLESLNLSTYDELFDMEIVYNLSASGSSCTMSINNIYLNNQTTHWNTYKIPSDYYKTFSKWANDAIFSYCPAFFREIKNCSLCFDVNTSFSHFKLITNKTLSFSEEENEVYSYKYYRGDGQVFSYQLGSNEIKTNFVDTQHIVIYVSLGVMLLYLVFLMLNKTFRRNMIKPSLMAVGITLFFVFIFELIKIILPTTPWTMIVFNYIGCGLSLLFLVYVVIFAFIFKEEKK